MDSENLIKNKILDAANRSFKQNIYTYTNFLSISELSIFHKIKKELNFVKYKTFGGNDDCERQMIQFGSEEDLGYQDTFPISLIEVKPLIEKYGEELTHRDYLGALMNLGIKRELLGDIIIKGKTAYIYCTEHIGQFIIDNLSTVKHTHMSCNIVDISLDAIKPTLDEIELIAASPRIDAAVSSISKLSRSQSLELFRTGKVFINGLSMENNSYQLKENDILVIRGYGKYIYNGSGNETRKGRVYLKFKHYV